MDPPLNNPRANASYLRANTIVPRNPFRKMPIRLYGYKKILSIIGSDLR
jgi:hypothetical protein